MTPKACALYDTIKLYKLKHGYTPCVDDLKDSSAIQELVRNGWVRVVNIRKPFIRIYRAIEIIK